MKVNYTPAVQSIIDHVLAVGTDLPKGYCGDDSWAKEWPAGLRSFVYDLLPNSAIEAQRSTYSKLVKGKYVTANRKTTADGWEITFSADMNFDSRAQCLTWMKDMKLKLPRECKKEGELRGEKIVTKVIHKVKVTDEFTLKVTYFRAGAPTAHCRVEAQVYNTVVCDLH